MCPQARNRTSITAAIHRLCAEIRRACSVSAAAPPVWFRGVHRAFFQAKRFSLSLEKGSIVAGITRFAAATLPKSPICALKLGDKTSITAAIYGLFAGLKRARCSTAATGEVFGGAQGVTFLGLALRCERGKHCLFKTLFLFKKRFCMRLVRSCLAPS